MRKINCPYFCNLQVTDIVITSQLACDSLRFHIITWIPRATLFITSQLTCENHCSSHHNLPVTTIVHHLPLYCYQSPTICLERFIKSQITCDNHCSLNHNLPVTTTVHHITTYLWQPLFITSQLTCDNHCSSFSSVLLSEPDCLSREVLLWPWHRFCWAEYAKHKVIEDTSIWFTQRKKYLIIYIHSNVLFQEMNGITTRYKSHWYT